MRVESDGEEVSNNYLHAIRDRLSDEGVASVEKRVLHGHPAVTIVDLAHETTKSLVTMTTHVRSRIGRWVLGSVTDRVVRHSGDPVLVIRSSELRDMGGSTGVKVHPPGAPPGLRPW